MLREETDERVDYRAAKADGYVINNHRKACDICTHETADNRDANHNRLSQHLLNKGDPYLNKFLQMHSNIFSNQSGMQFF